MSVRAVAATSERSTRARWLISDSLVLARRNLVPADAPWPLQHPVIAAVLWCVALIAVAAPLCVSRFRARTSG